MLHHMDLSSLIEAVARGAIGAVPVGSHNIDLILTLTAGLATALLLGYGTQWLGLSPIVGYLLAGIVIGPSTPGFAANQAYADQFAEMGVVLLMFGVGLHFHVGELLAVRKIAIPGPSFRV